MKKIYLHTLPGEDVIAWSGEPFRALVARLLTTSQSYAPCESPEEADLILLLEICRQKGREHPAKLLADPVFSAHAPKVFTLNIDDNPVPFLPGGYVNLPKKKHTPATIATGYLMAPNERVEHWANQRQRPRRYDASFRGTVNCPAREQLFANRDSFGENILIEHPPDGAWYQHKQEAKDRYCEEILDSHFVLCPGGLGPSTYRLYEAMQLERAPVILSDRWEPPNVTDWRHCAIVLPERDIPFLARALDGRLGDACRIATNARAVWEKHFDPEKQIIWILDCLFALKDANVGRSAEAYNREWNREAFWAQHGLGRHQQILRKIQKLLRR